MASTRKSWSSATAVSPLSSRSHLRLNSRVARRRQDQSTPRTSPSHSTLCFSAYRPASLQALRQGQLRRQPHHGHNERIFCSEASLRGQLQGQTAAVGHGWSRTVPEYGMPCRIPSPHSSNRPVHRRHLSIIAVPTPPFYSTTLPTRKPLKICALGYVTRFMQHFITDSLIR
jgi:hypothetical protein